MEVERGGPNQSPERERGVAAPAFAARRWQPLPQKLRINTRNRPRRCVGGCAGIRWARRTRPRASGEASIEAFFPFFAHFDFFSASHGRGSDGFSRLAGTWADLPLSCRAPGRMRYPSDASLQKVTIEAMRSPLFALLLCPMAAALGQSANDLEAVVATDLDRKST